MKEVKVSGMEINRVIDSETGEELEVDVIKHTYLAGSKDQFFLGYVTMLSLFQKMSAPSIKVFSYILERYNAGVMIGINTPIRNEMQKVLGFTADSTIKNALTELVKVKLLYRENNVNGAYYINPRHAFKGSSRDRDKLLKVVIELYCENC
jgi:hypothetical protein